MSLSITVDLMTHHDHVTWRQASMWLAAGLTVLSIHVGGSLWAMWNSPAPSAEEFSPAAIMVEMTLAPVAPEAIEEYISAPQAEPVETPPDPTAEPVPVEQQSDLLPDEPQEEIEPVADASTPVAEEVDAPEEAEFAEPVVEQAAVPLPAPRPAPRVAPRQPPRPQPVVKPRPAAPPAPPAAQATVRAQPAPVAAAAQSSRGSVTTISPATWQSRLLAHLERNKRYPAQSRSRKEQGVAQVRFRIDAGGRVISVSLARSSGFPALDAEVVAMVRRASPVPAPPPGVALSFTVPVRFSLR